MKKIVALLLVAVMAISMAACTPAENTTPSTTTKPNNQEPPASSSSSTPEAPKDDPAVKGEGVMTYEQYAAAELETEVVIEAYVQACQGWWEKDGQGVITVYTQDLDGAYFLYNMPCSQEDAAKLTKGTKIWVKGTKVDYKGEIEIEATEFKILEGSYIAEATDVTALLANEEELIKKQNMFVSFKGMTVVASKDKDGNDVAFLYNWNGSGEPGSDLYFNVEVDGKTYNFCVESYLCGQDTDVYKAVEALKIGDKIDLEGFLYWYDGVNPHITSVKAAA